MAFEYFVILAEMRTGSNLLESNLNAFDGIECHGELFNPAFINTAGTHEFLGVSYSQREDDPWRLLNAARAGGGRMVGFRLFHDHDPRIRQHVLADTACAKIVLTRNPLDSYVSRKIAAATGQWRLGNVVHRKASTVRFDGVEFETHVAQTQATQIEILHALQTTGQTAFYIGYDDLNDLDVLNGLARWLGVPARITDLPRTVKKQNPEPIAQKLENPQDLAAGLARIDRFGLGRTPNFEVRRGPLLAAVRGGLRAPLLFLPMRGAPEGAVIDWLAALDGVQPADLPGDFDAARLTDWRRAHPGFRSFTVLRHPLKRAHDTFCRKVLTGDFGPVREHMNRLFAADLPEPGAVMTPDTHRAAFKAFLRFARASISGQTGMPPWPMWATQAANLDGYAQVMTPDAVLREETLAEDLRWLARRAGLSEGPVFAPAPETAPHPLTLIADDEVMDLCRTAYARDYASFGFTTD
ncbi:MAG: nodulation protein NodH [Rhodobacter sp.]|nr:nodulation protein NodH [Paracoccaceae bacterium]MCC0078046.1 nodulation protein NodH [Rhodobacter sp.]